MLTSNGKFHGTIAPTTPTGSRHTMRVVFTPVTETTAGLPEGDAPAIGADPVEAGPLDAGPVDAEPVDTAPVDAEPTNGYAATGSDLPRQRRS